MHELGTIWFRALTAEAEVLPGDPPSVLTADAMLDGLPARFVCVVPNPEARFPCARHGEVGLDEAYALAARVREAMALDADGPRRPIVAIVDVKSQAYGRREETAAIFLAGAMAADAYASARRGGHPVIALVVGEAFSGGFLTHGYQASRILAFDHAGVTIHAMHREAAARITRQTLERFSQVAETIAPLSYGIEAFARLGLLHRLLPVADPYRPSAESIAMVRQALSAAVASARSGPPDLSSRWDSPAASERRAATLRVRALMQAQWSEPSSSIPEEAAGRQAAVW